VVRGMWRAFVGGKVLTGVDAGIAAVKEEERIYWAIKARVKRNYHQHHTRSNG
jgi:hypothetical protein